MLPQGFFHRLRGPERPEKVTLGDGRNLEAVGRGTVSLVLKSPGSEAKPRKL